jgi:hypothetical protein
MANSNHQPYEEWLLSGDTLPPEPAKQLSQHLLTCEQCQMLAAGLQGVEQRLSHAVMAAPASGFATRWQQRLGEERLRRNKRHAIYFLALSLGGAVILLGVLTALFWPLLQSPYPLLLAVVLRLGSTLALVGEVATFGTTVLLTFARVIPPSLGFAILIAILALLAVWIVALRKIALQHRSAS